ncbi:hypothetical protein HDV05_000155 [Chytridiales sp. JEL 0842]|nr:hypothetical protein HDV05_000155 [Chytridiales sp. JEL 0842]
MINMTSLRFDRPLTGPERFQTEGYRVEDKRLASETAFRKASHHEVDFYVEERFGRNLDTRLADKAKLLLRKRIAGVIGDFVSDSDSSKQQSGDRLPIVQRMKNVTEEHYNSFPYTDTLKIQEKFGHGCFFLGHGNTSDLDKLEIEILPKNKIAAFFCEFPSNPLLKTVDLKRVRRLADQYDFLVVVDETVGNFVNVGVLEWADIVVSSLTKVFSGDCNVMGGSMIINPSSMWIRDIKAYMGANYEENLWCEDAIFLERNSRFFTSRIYKINENALLLANFLRGHEKIRDVFYPKFTDAQNYTSYMRPSGGYGGLLSIVFHNHLDAPTFYDRLQKLELHREILKTADTVHDEQEREKLLMTSSVYAGNKKKYATPESIAKHNAASHRSRAKSITEQEGVAVIQAHCRSMQDNGIKAMIRGRLTGVDLRGDLVYFDTESKSRSHTHPDTTLWAFFRVTQGFLSVSRSSTDKYWVWLEGKKSLLASPDALEAISRFVGTARVVYFASSNAIDLNRLEDWYKLEQKVVPFRWLNAGFDVLFKVFGRKDQPILSPNCELQTVYANLWQLGGRGDIYYTDHTQKAALFPQVPWSLAKSETGKVWVDCLMLFDIVECVRCLVNYE